MKERKKTGVFLCFVLSVSIITSSITALLLAGYFNHIHFQRTGYFLQEILEKQPEIKQTILEVLKESKEKPMEWSGENILTAFGYQKNHFEEGTQRQVVILSGLGLIFGMGLFWAAFWLWHRRQVLNIQTLTAYLEQVNAGGQGLLFSTSEDEFSKLQDEIYKTVISLHQTRDTAIQARDHFADNLFNIAHQLKTPITAISLSTQMMQEQTSLEYPGQIQKQLKRLTHLEEALLLLSRIDAGTLALKNEKVDVFTVLTLAADNLQELFEQADVSIDIPELGEIEITGDLDWTMEIIMNLYKNCMEHTPAGKKVYCSYEQNPLYTKIRIWDKGQGFHKDDIPHLFERFYRGKDAKDSGIGIGLSLAKAIIEMQNGVISADNLPNGGACFEIRIYSH